MALGNKRTGKMIYVPQIVLDELDNFMEEDKKRGKALEKMSKASKLGRMFAEAATNEK